MKDIKISQTTLKTALLFLPFVLSVICLLASSVIGTEPAADGGFGYASYLIPMGYVFLMMGIVTMGMEAHKVRKKAKEDQKGKTERKK